MARAMVKADDDLYDEALSIVADAREQIDARGEVDAEEFFSELERSREALDELEREFRDRRPLSEKETLEKELQQAIDGEEFETAARLRDQLKNL